jgi:hypothetical protein
VSLLEYAKAHPVRRGNPCWVCSLPQKLRSEVDEALNDRSVLVPQIVAYLVEKHGYDPEACTRPKFNNHRIRGHHKLKAGKR